MFSFISTISVALLAVSSASALAIPRRSAIPATYAVGYLESYHVYHTRYLALDCEAKHNETFFDQCCHPLLATESLQANRPAQCIPSAAASSSASLAEPTSTVTTPADEPECTEEADDGEEEEDEDDLPFCTDEPESSSAAPPAPSTSVAAATSSAVSTPTVINVAPVPTPSAVRPAAPLTTSSSSKVEPTTTEKAAPSTTEKAAPTTTEKAAPTTTEKVEPTTTAKAAPTTAAAPASNNAVNLGGVATFFFQNGVAGACGTVHSDNDFIAAIDQDRYGNSGNESPLCGQKVKITNTANGKTVTVTIADDCPTCNNSNSIDLSVAAFEQIGTQAEGEVNISWQFI